MPRIRPMTEQEASPEVQGYLQKDIAAFGTVLNSSSITAYRPSILVAAKGLGAGIEQSGLLSRELRCLVSIKSASMVGCPF